MAGNKKPRKPAKPQSKRTTAHIVRAVRLMLREFHVVGDMNHRPTVFNFSKLHSYLKGSDLRIGQDHAIQWLCLQPRAWTMLAVHFFITEEGIEVIPTSLVLQDATLASMGSNGEDLLKQMREALFESDPAYNEDTLQYYGYYITHGEDLNLEKVETDIADSFLKITQDLTKIEEYVVEITEDKVLEAIGQDKFSIADRNALSTKMVQKE